MSCLEKERDRNIRRLPCCFLKGHTGKVSPGEIIATIPKSASKKEVIQ